MSFQVSLLYSGIGCAHRNYIQRRGCIDTSCIEVILSFLYSREFTIALASVVLTVASYNGASFYIDVFSQRYHKETVEKQKKT